MRELLEQLVEDFNNYSELVALNYAKIKEGACGRDILEWNRGGLNKIEDYLRYVADTLGVKLIFEWGEHPFGYDDWKRTLEYRTVRIER